jgi:cytochrome P450
MSKTRYTAQRRLPPGPRGLPLLGSIVDLRRKGVLRFYLDAWHEFGDVLQAQMGPLTIFQFVRPEHVHHILVGNRENYVKGFSHDKLRVPLGSGLLTSEGELWQRQRRLMSATYTPRGVTHFAEIMTDATKKMLNRWEKQPDGEPLPINVEMMRLAMSVISRSMFTIDIGEEFADAGKALHFILEFANRRTISLIDPPLFLPTPMNQGLKKALETLDQFLYGIIAERRRQPAGDDLLSTLMHARDEKTGETMNEQQLRDEVLITFFAGHETTAQLLTWTWYLLARHPEVESKLHEQLERVLGGRTPTLDDVPNLAYTRMVLDETLRLYSPVAMMARDALRDDEIAGYAIPTASMVTLTPYITHRHPEFWEKPGTFYPEHFAPERIANRPRYAYYPFGAGPRICLGKHFALLEATLVLAEVAQRVRLQLVPGQEIDIQWSGTLRPNRAVMMNLQRRPSGEG